MADATTARSDDASCNEELRPEDTASTLVALAMHLAANEYLFVNADRQVTRRKHPAFRIAHDQAFSALCDTQFALLHALPEDDDRDLLILAGFASMLGDQLPDTVAPGDTHTEKLCEGIKAALTALTAAIAQNRPAVLDGIEAIHPELARCIRQDILLTDMRRADAEGR